ncbi:uncharacterized protein LOC111700772 [Eurytemora carolleeae]|uniref:uncharacterized protein LOC111700772 n=1 Tax=Eurytemora carolleeae TaxID=1294199 RepID=UPI000C77C30F|nr:uncharacterized protein LOC111700772 [Eurytemora carolleeae]|eukprot:XP_023327578.1 uncharacterized protein LOC111700772 [Eurytemora affinis]
MEYRDNSPSISRSSTCCSAPHGQRMVSERKGCCQMITSPEGRISLIGTSLAFIHCAGIVVSLYYLITNYLNDDPSAADDPISHICTDALLCILFRFGPNKEHTGQTSTALAGQLLFSLTALTVNLFLVGGALGNRPLALLSWLIFYFFNILGCFVLSGILGATVVHRNKYYGDIELDELAWILVPLLLSILYLISWIIVFMFFRKLRREQLTLS